MFDKLQSQVFWLTNVNFLFGESNAFSLQACFLLHMIRFEKEKNKKKDFFKTAVQIKVSVQENVTRNYFIKNTEKPMKHIKNLLVELSNVICCLI